MGFLDKAKAAADQAKVAADQATTRAREGIEEVQAKRGASHAYEQLGRVAFELIEAGEISHERLLAPAAEIRHMQATAGTAPGA
jgi:hypothetical protein